MKVDGYDCKIQPYKALLIKAVLSIVAYSQWSPPGSHVTTMYYQPCYRWLGVIHWFTVFGLEDV